MRWRFPKAGCAWRRVLPVLSLVSLLTAPLAAETIDRVVAVVGQQAITASEVDQQLRLEALFNRERLQIAADQRGQALQRLIAIRLIQAEAAMAGFLRTSEEEVQRRLEQSKQELYIDGLPFAKALEVYGLREQDVLDFWRQVIGYERFKDFRFRTGLEVSAEQIAAYYEQHVVAEFRSQGNSSPPPLDEVYEKVEQAVIEEQTNAMLEEWLKEMRPQTRIVILEERQTPAANEGEAAPEAAVQTRTPQR